MTYLYCLNVVTYHFDQLHKITSSVDEALGKPGASFDADASPKPQVRLLVLLLEAQSKWAFPGRLTNYIFHFLRAVIILTPPPSSPHKFLTYLSLSVLQFGLAATHTVWECMIRCFSEDVFLLPVAHRFTRLTLQVCTNTYIFF